MIMKSYALLSLLHCQDKDKLLLDAYKIKAGMQDDACDTLSIILENKYSENKKALRLIKRYCISENISWEIKRACDFTVYRKE